MKKQLCHPVASRRGVVRGLFTFAVVVLVCATSATSHAQDTPEPHCGSDADALYQEAWRAARHELERTAAIMEILLGCDDREEWQRLYALTLERLGNPWLASEFYRLASLKLEDPVAASRARFWADDLASACE